VTKMEGHLSITEGLLSTIMISAVFDQAMQRQDGVNSAEHHASFFTARSTGSQLDSRDRVSERLLPVVTTMAQATMAPSAHLILARGIELNPTGGQSLS
jgi:hypothetical protein